ncbi:J domain-containing protein [Streptomyces sp. NPDC085529]|uniref:J domain-containing protein n=1 Tax=Streptomyces sp. NPDC085529 TaxID=3365729 RepID=UPI0037CD44DF
MKASRQPDHYGVLGVEPAASLKEITSAYRAMIRALHPDAHPGRQTNTERLESVIAAYATLRDSRLRAEYDESRTTAVPVRQRSPLLRPDEHPYVVVIGTHQAAARQPRVAWLRAGPVTVEPPR